MEKKIGEIFEYDGEWYQCLKEKTCTCFGCDFRGYKCDDISLQKVKGSCQSECRKDNKSVIFKKLEKVEEPYEKRVSDGTFSTFQRYKVYNSVILPKKPYMYYNFIDSTIEIEIKQNKENMEEKKQNLRPFNLEAAKAGEPVCTRDGRKARIICFDRINGDYYKIVACVTAFDGDFEEVLFYGIDGYIVDSQNPKDEDLMMLPEKKEGWVNVYKDGLLGTRAYNTKKEAVDNASPCDYVDTVKISWEE